MSEECLDKGLISWDIFRCIEDEIRDSVEPDRAHLKLHSGHRKGVK